MPYEDISKVSSLVQNGAAVPDHWHILLAQRDTEDRVPYSYEDGSKLEYTSSCHGHGKGIWRWGLKQQRVVWSVMVSLTDRKLP